MEKHPQAVKAFLDYIYENYYKLVAEIRGYITEDMWAIQEMIGADDLTEQRLLREAQTKLKQAWKRSDDPQSLESIIKRHQSQAVSGKDGSVRSSEAGTDESPSGGKEQTVLQDSSEGSN